MSDIKSIIKHELEDGGYIWMEDSTSRFKVVGENGTLELAPITLAGFPYIAFGMNAQGRPSVNGTILLWHADETKTRALVSGVLANIIKMSGVHVERRCGMVTGATCRNVGLSWLPADGRHGTRTWVLSTQNGDTTRRIRLSHDEIGALTDILWMLADGERAADAQAG